MVLGDEYVYEWAVIGPIIREGREQGWLSPLFPLVLLSVPMFWLGAILVRIVEGKRQAFNWHEALLSVRSQIILGVMWSFGPLSKWFVDENKTEMTAWEFAWKTLVAMFIVDAAFYWMHRAMHDIPMLRFIHIQHHKLLAKHTVWGGVDEDVAELPTIFLYITLPFAFLSVMPEFICFFIAGGAFQTALMHGTEVGGDWFPPWPMVGAKVHHGHHQTITKNYGGVFVFWDYLMHTNKKSVGKIH